MLYSACEMGAFCSPFNAHFSQLPVLWSGTCTSAPDLPFPGIDDSAAAGHGRPRRGGGVQTPLRGGARASACGAMGWWAVGVGVADGESHRVHWGLVWYGSVGA